MVFFNPSSSFWTEDLGVVVGFHEKMSHKREVATEGLAGMCQHEGYLHQEN